MRPEPERFADALDARTMGPRLAAALGGAPTCHVLDAKYEPGVRAIVLYDLAGRLVRGDLTEGAPDPGAHRWVVEPGLRVRVFPDDPDLPNLPLLTDPGSLGPVLARLRPTPDGRAAGRCRTRLLRYRPGKRATVLARTAPSLPPLVAKAYHRPDKAAAVAEEAAALSTVASSATSLRLAPPVGLVAEWDVVVQEAVGGTPLDALLVGTGATRDQALEGVGRAARALAELHALPAVSRRQRSVLKELRRFQDRAAGVAGLDPGFAAAATRLAERLVEGIDRLPAPRVGPVHGDCKPSQFLLGARVHLLDLDHHGLSDQAADVGTFLATLRQYGVRRDLSRRSRGARTDTRPLEQAFLDHYLSAGDGDVDSLGGRARWQQAVALERKALRAFARAPRSTLAPALVKEANRCLDAAEQAA